MNIGELSVNMKQLKRWKVDSDNVKFYDKIWQNQGKFYTLDVRPYVELLQKYNIFYTLNVGKLPLKS